MAEFDSPAAIMHAAEKTRDAGYRWFDCHVPFPVHGLDRAMGVRPTVLPIFVFFGGLTGAVMGAILQWYTNAVGFDFWLIVPVRGYEFLISGKPFLSGQVYPIVMFEMTILFSAFAAVGGMFIFNGLPKLYHPTLKSRRFARATNDRFFLVLEAKDPNFVRADAEALLQSMSPLSIEALES
jgi:hypothetical protein